MDVRLTLTDCAEVGDYVVPNVLSPSVLVSRSDNMKELYTTLNQEDQWSYKRSPDYWPGKTTTKKIKKQCCESFVKISSVAMQ